MRCIPNILSALRILMVGVYVWLFRAGRYLPALSVFFFAMLTDALDGFLARRFCWITDVGKLLDPLADKLMTVAALICVYRGSGERVYFVLFLLMAAKELLMILGGALMARRGVTAQANWPGKLATGLFAAGLTLSLIGFLPVPVRPWDQAILIGATGLSYFAMLYYMRRQFLSAMAQAPVKRAGMVK